MPADDTLASPVPLDAILQKVLEAVPFQLTTDGGADACRQRFRDLPRMPVHPEVRAEDRTIEGPAGPIPIRLYWPPESAAPTPPVVMFFHGGGWVVGDLDTYDNAGRRHAVGAGALVVSVDYRLAPEHPYPAAVDDVWAATQWVAEHAAELGADPAALRWPAIRRAATSRRSSPSWRATPAGPRCASSCCGTRRRPGTPRCRRSPRTPTRRS